jgi:hypothetical protein
MIAPCSSRATIRTGNSARAPFGAQDNALDTPTGRPVTGPKGIERHVNGGGIAWLERREKRGEAVTPNSTGRHGNAYFGSFTTVVFAREIQPDPASPAKMIIALGKDKGTAPLPPPGYVPTPGRLMICVGISPAGSSMRGGGCGYLSDMFADSPITYSSGPYNGGDQFAPLSGAASDDVRSLELYLTDGTIQKVRIEDNVFATSLARAEFPVRIVARDEQGAIIGNEVLQNA